jgi:MbtH protein
VHNDEEDTRTYDVVMNHEEQYSIWVKGRELPAGWVTVGKSGLKAECLQYIEEVWTDMRPLSLRKHMEAFEAEQRAAAGTESTEQVATVPLTVEGLPGSVTRPTVADQPTAAELR